MHIATVTTSFLLYTLVGSIFWTAPQTWNWFAPNDHPHTLFNFLDSTRLLFAALTSVYLELTFWTAQYLLLCVTRNPTLFKQYTISKTHVTYPATELIQTALSETIQGHCLRPIFLWLAYPVYKYRGCLSAPVPSLFTLCAQLLFCILIDDTLFYWSHRLLHANKWLYRTIHKQHHEFKYSVGLAVEYAHPIEDILSNTLPTVAGALLLGSHASVAIGYMGIKIWQSIDAHSGFNLPFPLSPWNIGPGMDCASAHDYHHSHNCGNYGGFFSFWDWLCGTDKSYQKYLKKEQERKKEKTFQLKIKRKNKIEKGKNKHKAL